MSQPSSGTPGPSRRAVSTAAAWSAPVVAATFASPFAAASAVVTCESAVNFRAGGNAGGDTATLRATSPSGAVTSVRITSVLAPGTTTTTQGVSYNLSQGGTAWGGDDVTYQYGPRGAMILNQRREGTIGQVPAPGSDSQTLTFQFLDPQGQVFDPVGLRLEFWDITSQLSRSWTSTHWDALGFSVEPSTISRDRLSEGVGAGTIADPYRREADDETTLSFFRLDAFSFDVFPSGSTLTYTQHAGKQGWHAVFLTGLSFRTEDC